MPGKDAVFVFDLRKLIDGTAQGYSLPLLYQRDPKRRRYIPGGPHGFECHFIRDEFELGFYSIRGSLLYPDHPGNDILTPDGHARIGCCRDEWHHTTRKLFDVSRAPVIIVEKRGLGNINSRFMFLDYKDRRI